MKKKIYKQNNIINKSPTLKPELLAKNNKLQKKSKRLYVIAVSYLLVFGATGLMAVFLLFNSDIKVNNTNFNPDANNDIWNQYYNNHKVNNKPINLSGVVNYFGTTKNNTVKYDVEKSGALTYQTILNGIDNNLKEHGLEDGVSATNSNSNDKLPEMFFSNVIFNPAVKIDIKDSGKLIPIEEFVFNPSSDYHTNKTYELDFIVNNDDCADFDIVKAKDKTGNDFKVNLELDNNIAVDIKDIQLGTLEQNISIKDPETTINNIKDVLLPPIKTKFTTLLAEKLQVSPTDILDNYYTINFTDPKEDVKINFSQVQKLNFTITTSKTDNQWHFHGQTTGIINVQNETIDLSQQGALKDKIEGTFDEEHGGTGISEILANDNDTNVTSGDITTMSNDIISKVKPLVTQYLEQKAPQIKVEDKDYTITADFKGATDIFNDKKGVTVTLKIAANDTYKLKNSLDEIKVTIHGHNKNSISNNFQQKKDFNINGIYLPSKQDTNVLQNDSHWYDQTNLYNAWIGDKDNLDSLLNNIKNKAYKVNPDSFKGIIDVQSTLDSAPHPTEKTFKIEDIKNDKVSNFYDLLFKTKGIFLKTVVTPSASKTNSDRTFDDEELVFVSDRNNPDVDKNVLYSIDLCNNHHCSIKENATLVFNSFTFNIDYTQES